MMTAVLLLLVTGSAVWVGIDAQTRDFSNHRFANSTAQWVLGTVALWIIVFPAYLVVRDRAPLRRDLFVPPAPVPAAPRVVDDTAPGSVAPPGH
jgi:hypothetical protein